ncbi:acetyl-coenzyme A synthetase N-terminal domain-containing protein [Methanogenium cariaci]|uniref:acetyl-coenzyme A synthetase N-terminal domain-containing protein n=1 Tax=Methanogenium cariaci TaxID=2197 RepID=UPI001FDFDC9D|nr:acetyl-coenzyme A synthetase N-terminal domain-containing protein [Methanogenium cariaci]
MSGSFDVKLEETVYLPDPLVREQSWIGDYDTEYQRFLRDPDGFWEGGIAGELDWFRRWDHVKKWDLPYAEWFTNAQLNITHNCLDRHATGGERRNKVALIWRGGEKEGQERVLTYRQLYRQVMRFASALKKMGD